MKKLCFTFSCLLATASLSLSAQANYTPVNIGSVNVGSSVTTSVVVAPPSSGLARITVSSLGNTINQFTDAGTGTCATGGVYNPGAYCTVNVTFTPLHGSTQFGAVMLLDTYGNTVAAQLIQGTGTAPESSFSPGHEYSLGVVANASTIAIGKGGTLFIPGDGYGRGGTAVQASLYEILHSGPSTYSHPGSIAKFFFPGAWADQIGNSFTGPLQIPPFNFARNMDTVIKAPMPQNLAGDLAGNLFIVKPDGSTVYKETPIAMTQATQGTQSYTESIFAAGTNVWTDWFGNVFVLNGGQFYKYILQTDGSYAPTVVLQSLSSNLTVDGYGNIYGSINGGTALYKETLQPNGAYVLSAQIPTANPAPGNLTVDDDTNLFYQQLYADYSPYGPNYRSIIKEDFIQTPTLAFATSAEGSPSSDSPRIVTITNHGNQPLQFSTVTYPTDFPEAKGATGDCQAGTSLLAEESCTVSITFTPITPLNASNTPAGRNGSVKIVTNTLNNPSTEQDIAVSGTETLGPAATPTFSVAPGSYNNMQTVAITDVTPGAKIYYTLNGSTPTTASIKYTGPVAVRNSSTMKAIAIATGATQSAIGSAAYKLVAATPVLSLAAGTYSGAQTVNITCASTAVRLIYTTNGSGPNASSPQYHGPITISASQTLRVLAVATGYTTSPMVSAKYTIQ